MEAALMFPGHETELCSNHKSKVVFTQQYHMFQELQRSQDLWLWKAYSLTITERCPCLQQL